MCEACTPSDHCSHGWVTGCEHLLQVEWLREKSRDIPIRLVFESALELMGTTQHGGFKVRALQECSVASSLSLFACWAS